MKIDRRGPTKKDSSMPSLFKTEQEANDYKEKHQLFVRVPEPISGTGMWALVFPIKAHVTVVPHTEAL